MKSLVLTITTVFLTLQITFAQTIDIPDPNFKVALILEGVDTNSDGEIQISEAEAIVSLSPWGMNIVDLTGIEYFINLRVLYCVDNQLTSLDLSQNVLLEQLYVGTNNLSSLDLSQNVLLKFLNAGSNNLSSLDLSQNVLLKELQLDYNYFSSLDLSQNVLLENLGIHYNNLSNLDVSQNVLLEELQVDYNNLSSIDVSTNLMLSDLYCEGNPINSLDLSVNPNVSRLLCSHTPISYLNLKNGNNTNITDNALNATNTPNLYCIITDDAAWSTENWTNINNHTSFVNHSRECTALSIADNSLESNAIKIYPNPTTGVLNVIIRDNRNTNYTLKVVNSLGQLVLESNINSEVSQINLSKKAASGLYYVQIIDDNNSLIDVKKILVL